MEKNKKFQYSKRNSGHFDQKKSLRKHGELQQYTVVTVLPQISIVVFYGLFETKTTKKPKTTCAAKAFYSCPAIISRRPGSQDTSKEPQLNPEEDSRIKQARSHVTLEKSS